VGDFGEGHVEGSGKVGTGTIEYTAPELVKSTDPPDGAKHRNTQSEGVVDQG
jgi:hypothetical protein